MNANEVVAEVVAMLDTKNAVAAHHPVKPGSEGKIARVSVYGDTLEEIRENMGRVRDACKALGAKCGSVKSAAGYSITPVAFENDPFNQIKHYFAQIRVLSAGTL